MKGLSAGLLGLVVVAAVAVVGGGRPTGAEDNAQPGAADDPPAAPLPRLAPIMNFQDNSDVCRSWLAVENLGQEATKAVLVVWGGAHSSNAGCMGPLKAECTGLIRPGGTWNLFGAQTPSGARSGIVYSLSPRPLSAIGVPSGPDDLIADQLCEKIFFGVVGDCADFAAFNTAYAGGGVFAGIPMAEARGAPIGVQVLRHCPGDSWPGVEVSSSYSAPALDPEAMESPSAPDKFTAYALPVTGPSPGRGATRLYVQSGASEPTQAEVWLAPYGAPAPGHRCVTLDLWPGESVTADIAPCTNPGQEYVALVEATGPVAVAADLAISDTMSTVAGIYPRRPRDAAGYPVTGPESSAFAPALLPAATGWETRVHVLNLGPDLPISLRLQAGDIVTTGQLCAGCGNVFDLPGAIVPAGGEAAGLAIVGDALSDDPPPPIRAVVQQATSLQPGFDNAFLELALPDQVAAAGGTSQGTAVLGLPLVTANLDGTGTITEVAITNFLRDPGTTQVALLIFDANDLVALRCREVGPGATIYVDPEVEAITRGFLGSGVISATAWSHGDGSRVGLGAALLTRTATRRGANVPGDEVAILTGLAMARVPAYPGRALPPCPGPAPAPGRPDPEPAPGHAAAMARLAQLPVLRQIGRDLSCSAAVRVRNNGTEGAKAILVAWSEAGFCPPQCAGPLAVTCSGLIAPGQEWDMATSIPPGSASAAIYMANSKTLRDLGIEASDELAADRLCDKLFFGIVGDCDDARRFALAWAAGATFEDIPLAQVMGPPAEVKIDRSCPDASDPGMDVASSYAGIVAGRFDPYASNGGGYVQSLTPVYAGWDGRDVIFYLQNGGRRCTSASLEFHPVDDWGTARTCTVFTLGPGETFPLAADNCVDPAYAGSLVVFSEEPLALVADVISPGDLRTIAARPGPNPFDLNGDGRVDARDLAVLEGASGTSPGDPGWNPAADLNADGRVDGADRDILLLQMAPTATQTPSPTPPAPTPSRPAPTVTPIIIDFLPAYLPLCTVGP